jgi:hypothetical protein
MPRTILLAVTLAVTASAADAGCRIKTAKCIEIPEAAYTAPYGVGDRLPQDSFEVLLNVTYHGLPPSDGTFWYVRSGRHVYKVTPGDFEVIGDVTREARRLRN